jgi:hypothetical protein
LQRHFEMFKYLMLVAEYICKWLTFFLSKQNRIYFFFFSCSVMLVEFQILMKFHIYFMINCKDQRWIIFVVICLCFVFWGRLMLYNHLWPWTHNPSTLSSKVLGLQACTNAQLKTGTFKNIKCCLWFNVIMYGKNISKSMS